MMARAMMACRRFVRWLAGGDGKVEVSAMKLPIPCVVPHPTRGWQWFLTGRPVNAETKARDRRLS